MSPGGGCWNHYTESRADMGDCGITVRFGDSQYPGNPFALLTRAMGPGDHISCRKWSLFGMGSISGLARCPVSGFLFPDPAYIGVLTGTGKSQFDVAGHRIPSGIDVGFWKKIVRIESWIWSGISSQSFEVLQTCPRWKSGCDDGDVLDNLSMVLPELRFVPYRSVVVECCCGRARTPLLLQGIDLQEDRKRSRRGGTQIDLATLGHPSLGMDCPSEYELKG